MIITALCDLHLTNLVAANIVFGPKSTIFFVLFFFLRYLEFCRIFVYLLQINNTFVCDVFCFVARIVQLELNVPVVFGM